MVNIYKFKAIIVEMQFVNNTLKRNYLINNNRNL